MPFRIKVSLAILLALAGLVLFGPLVIPIQPLEGLVPAANLADQDSRFVEVAGVELHVKTSGEPGSTEAPAFVLLHGFGASVYSWHEIMPELADMGGAVAFDRPGFGLSERPRAGEWTRGRNPYTPARQIDLTIGLMDQLGIDSAILVGNSSGGTVAAEVALRHPDRVAGLVLVNAAVYRSGGPPTWSRPLLHTPQMNRVGPLLMRTLADEPGENLIRAAWADEERIDEETLRAYRQYTQIEGWDRALWEISKATRPSEAEGRISEIAAPTLVVTGAADVIVPPEDAKRLAEALPAGQLAVLDDCGHVPQEECPAALLEQIRAWLGQAETSTSR